MPCQRHIVLLVGALAALVALPATAHGQRSAVEIWAATCGNCHLIQPANRYIAKDWDAIGTHMTITARLTDAQSTAVLAFLKANARRPDDGASATSEAPGSRAAALGPELTAAVARYLSLWTRTR